MGVLAAYVSVSMTAGEVRVVDHTLGQIPLTVAPDRATPIVVVSATKTTVTLQNADLLNSQDCNFFVEVPHTIVDDPTYEAHYNYWKGAPGSGGGTASANVINVKDYGATGNGVTNDLPSVLLARLAAKATGLPLYFPKGIYYCYGGSMASPWLILLDWQGFEVFGDGQQSSIIRGERTTLAGPSTAQIPIELIAIQHPMGGKIHDLTISGVNMIETLNADPETSGVYCRPMTSADTTLNVIDVYDCVIDGVSKPVNSPASSFIGNNQQLFCRRLNLTGYVVEVTDFDHFNSNQKSLVTEDCTFTCFDVLAECSGHCEYVGSQVAWRQNRNNFMVGPGFGWAAFKHFSSGVVIPPAKYAEFSNLWIGPGCLGYAGILARLVNTRLVNCDTYSNSGWQVRNNTTFTGCYFENVEGSIFCYSEEPGDALPYRVTIVVDGCTFKIDRAGALNYAAISTFNLINKTTWRISDSVIESSTVLTGSVCFVQCTPTGTGDGPIVDIDDCRANVLDDPANLSLFTFAQMQAGTWSINNCRGEGDMTVAAGFFRALNAPDLVEATINNCDTSRVTRGGCFSSDATSAGKFSGGNNKWGATTINTLLCNSGTQNFTFRPGLQPAALTAPATSAAVWTASTLYQVGQIVRNGANRYRVMITGTSAGAVGPTGTGTGIVDGTVTWDFIVASTTALTAQITPDYDKYDCNVAVDMIWANGAFLTNQAFNGQVIELWSAGALAFTALGNVIALSAAARAAGTVQRFRYTNGYWREYIQG